MKIVDEVLHRFQFRTKFNLFCGLSDLLLRKKKRLISKLFVYLMNHQRSLKKSYERGDGIAPIPPYIGIGVNDYCNLKCKMCPFVNSDLKTAMLPYDVLKNVVDEVCDGALMVGFSVWGEPLMHPQLFSMINYVISKNIVCAVGTNGTLLESKARELIDSGVNIINVSVDSIGPKHDEIRGVPGTFDRVVRGIRAIKSSTSRYDPIITVNCTISEYGYEHLTDLYQKMRDLDIDVFSVAHPAFIRTPRMLKAQNRIFRDSAIPTYEISWDAVDTAYQDIDINRLYEKTSTLMTKDEGIMVSFTPNLVELDELQTYYEFKKFVVLKDVRCAWLSAYVSSHGDLTMCDYYKLGNVIEEGSFRKAWNNIRYRAFRRLLKKHKRFPICVSCCRY